VHREFKAFKETLDPLDHRDPLDRREFKAFRANQVPLDRKESKDFKD